MTVDARTGQILFSDHADEPRHPASLTKMMTLYVLFQEMKAGRLNRESRLKISARAAHMAPSKLGLRPGSTISVDEAIRALVTKSANDAASAIGENIGGTESAFAQRMTKVAHSIGMNHSNFYNASGLPNPAQYTTARDLSTLGLRLMRDFPQYYPYFRITSFQFHGRNIPSHNALTLHYPGTDGFKTGYIAQAGYNLATSTKRGEKRLVGVVLGARSAASRTVYMRHMLEANFAKAHDGQTVAALAGSSAGVINPVATTQAAAPTTPAAQSAGLNHLGLAAAAADAAAPEAAGKEVTASTTPKVEDAQLEPVEGAKKPEKLPFAVVSANDNPNDLKSSYGESWNVQVGTYEAKPAAETQLATSRQKFATVFTGKPGFTMQDDKGGAVVYRARFAGFNAATAAKACAQIKRGGATCLTIQPEG